MKHGSRTLIGLVVLTFAVSMAPAAAYPQGTAASSLAGIVVDSAGLVLPGATVTAKNNATGTTFEAVTNERGAFELPALPAGVYTLTAMLSGFKSYVIQNIRLLPGAPAEVKARLEVGNFQETVVVTGGTELVQTRSAQITSTMTVDQIQALPLPTRNAVNFATFLPGVNTTGINRDANFNGLPSSAVAITLDGVNNNENYNKSTEGLFAMVTPRQDAVEAVTVTTAAGGADAGGHGAVTLRFVTRSGTDKFTGSAYEYWRDPRLNANYYFNQIRDLAKSQVKINQYGFRQGGPIVIPGLYDGRGKAFFFINYEELRMANQYNRVRTILTPDAQAGWYRAGSARVNLLDLAAKYGLTSTADPTVGTVLQMIRTATQSGGTIKTITDPNTLEYNVLLPGRQVEKQPTMRFDYNLSSKHRLTGTYIWQQVVRDPDLLNSTEPRFTGAPNYRKYVSYRKMATGALRSGLSATLVNELRGGIKYGPSYFGKPEWQSQQTFADEGGYALTLGNIQGTGGNDLTNWWTNRTPNARSAWSWNIDDTLTWVKGSHSFSFGGSYYQGHSWLREQTMAPNITFGVNSNDPASVMFSTDPVFKGMSSGQVDNARVLYALLTGRVTTIAADAKVDETTGKYALLGSRLQRLGQQELGLFVQDAWRVNERLTLNLGARWDYQSPIKPENSVLSTATVADLCGISGVGSSGYCNQFAPGAAAAVTPAYQKYDAGKPGYKTDWNNIAPAFGFAFRPRADRGFLRAILGDPEQATLRGGYSVGYNREGMALYNIFIGGNPGSNITVTRNAANGLLVPAGEKWPVLLREANRMAPAPFADAPSYPITATINDGMYIFDPDIKVSYAHTFSLGFQRALTKDTAVEVRYVGTRGRKVWGAENINEINVTSNGFLEEFKLAQQNLQANIAAGRGSTFKYFGPGSGTSPLPIMLAYFDGAAKAQAGDATKYKSTQWSNSTFYNALALNNPNPCCSLASTSTSNDIAARQYNLFTGGFAYNMMNDATRRSNAIAAGLAANFLVTNPAVLQGTTTGPLMMKSNRRTKYDALQVELRRRLSGGLQIAGSYQYAIGYSTRFLGTRRGYAEERNLGVPVHALKLSWNWILPVGRDRHFGGTMNRLLDAVIGGWEFHGDARVQTGLADFGNVRLVGMSLDELQSVYKIRFEKDASGVVKTVWILPQDIIENTIKAFSVSATSATGYGNAGAPSGRYLAPANSSSCIQTYPGECAPLHQYVAGPLFKRFDMAVAKRFKITGRYNFELRLDVMNVFNNVNWTAVADTGTSATINQVTSGYTDMSNLFDPGGRIGQIAIRFNW